jgi:ADP-heptose:LPS heptosyltransferase
MEVVKELPNIRKILVKCPPLLEDSFNSFPFLITLGEEFPLAEIFILCEENCSLAFQFLPFKARTFERPKEKMSLIQTHHFCANLNDIFNIDLFFDLENTFNSSFMGFNFRASARVGFGVGWNKYFLTKNFVKPENLTVEKRCLKLLELYTEKKYEELKISRVRTEGLQVEKIDQLFQEPEPPKFILVMLDNFQNTSKQISMWTKFFDSFQNQKFIIWSQQDEKLISELFFKIDLGENSLYMHNGSSSKELVYVLNKVKGVVANNIWAEGLCTYFGINSVSFLNNQAGQLPEYNYFHFKPQRFNIPDAGPIQYSYLEETREFTEMNEVVDQIHFHFKL